MTTSNVAGGLPIGVLDSYDHTAYVESGCAASNCHAGVAPGYFIDDTDIERTGTWTEVLVPAAVGGSCAYTRQIDATLQFTFSGTGFAWVGQRVNTGGIADIYVDGEFVKSANLYNGSWGYDKNIAVVVGLPYGIHTVEFKNTPKTSYLWNGMSVQGIRVYGEKPDFVATPDCSGCHEQHGDLSVVHSSTWTMDGCTGAGCHASSDLTVEHEQWIPDGSCAACHSAGASDTVKAAVTGGATACDACHVSVSGGATHRTLHESDVPLVDAAGVPQYGYYTGTAADIKVADCAGCHTSNLVDEHMGGSGRLPRYDFTGEALTCATCHESSDLKVSAAIAGGISNCDACHTVHAPLWSAHDSDFTTDPAAICGTCHSSSLEAVHQAVVATTPSGVQLSGCAVCHGYTEGDFGATIQAAIESTDGSGSLCTACHSAYHGEAAAKHSASTAASIDGCAGCHDDDPDVVPMDVTTLHASTGGGGCVVCHANPDRVPDITAVTAECASCHTTVGVDYHSEMDTAHTYADMDASCSSASCHAGNSLPAVHEPYLSAYPSYVSTCELCHRNADPGRIDWVIATADCSTCHTVHGDIATLHSAPESQACVDCHETAEVIVVHGGDASCAVCHNDGLALPDTTKCVNCHDEYSVIDPAHYPADVHVATAETGCTQCHHMDMKAEHFKPTVAVTCVTCHEVKVDAFSAAWDDTCAACHPVKHADQEAKHASSSTTCAGSGCHDITDVSVIHSALASGGCGSCHLSADQPAATTECVTCHESATPGHHEEHDASAVNPRGCAGCHFMYLDTEHLSLGLACDTCHASTDDVVKQAIADGDRDCLACHGDSPHNGRQSWEFNPAQASVHRVSEDLPGMRSSFVVGGRTYTWSLPSASSFLKSGYTTSSMVSCSDCHAYTDQMVGPHGAAVSVNIDPAYPRAYRTAFLLEDGTLGMNTDTICAKCHDLVAGSTWSNKVHDKHSRTEDGDSAPSTHRQGPGCITCHVGIPHGWSRPRMIGYQTDAAPYATDQRYGVIAIALRNYTNIQSDGSTGWSEQYCAAECGGETSKHAASRFSGTAWVGVDPTPKPDPTPDPTPDPITGSVTGKVTAASTGGALSGASVTIGSATALSGTDGAYTIADLVPGAYSVSVTLTGYQPWSGTVTVAAGSTAVRDVVLTPVPAPTVTNLALGRTATASSQDSWSYPPSRAVDGRTDTYWRSDRGSTEWIRVDLGSSYAVSKVVFNWFSNDYARRYRVQVSTDGYNWSDVYSTYYGQGGVVSHEFSAVNARYVRLYCTYANDNDYRLLEFEVYGN